MKKIFAILTLLFCLTSCHSRYLVYKTFSNGAVVCSVPYNNPNICEPYNVFFKREHKAMGRATRFYAILNITPKLLFIENSNIVEFFNGLVFEKIDGYKLEPTGQKFIFERPNKKIPEMAVVSKDD